MPTSNKIAGTSDDALKARTGKIWSQWFAILDKKKASEMPHKEMAIFLTENHNVPPWFAQTITVGYEQERGLRQVHQQPEGFQITKSKTLPVSALKAFQAWNEKKARGKWLSENITIRKATPSKSLRITWPEKTNVEVNFYPKGQEKCQITVQHSRLSNEKQAEKMKEYWTGKLEKYKEFLTA